MTYIVLHLFYDNLPAIYFTSDDMTIWLIVLFSKLCYINIKIVRQLLPKWLPRVILKHASEMKKEAYRKI